MDIKLRPEYDRWSKDLEDKTAQAKIAIRLTRILDGNFGVHKTVGAGVSELVIDYGPGYRVY